MAKITATKAILACVVLYGGYRVVRGAQRRRTALPPAPPPPKELRASSGFIDWRETSKRNMLDAVEAALVHDIQGLDGISIRSVAYSAGTRLWPGLAIHPSGLDALELVVRECLRWPGVLEETEETQSAMLRWCSHSRIALDHVVASGTDHQLAQVKIAQLVFPHEQWPPTKTGWQKSAWEQCGRMAERVSDGVPQAQPDDITAPIDVEPTPLAIVDADPQLPADGCDQAQSTTVEASPISPPDGCDANVNVPAQEPAGDTKGRTKRRRKRSTTASSSDEEEPA
jgi:hypothetical protein